MATLLFSSIPSTPFLLKNPNPSHYSSNFICNVFPISISKRGRLVLRRSSISASAAVEFAVDAQTRGAGRAHHLDISKLGISEEIVSSLSKKGITELFPIQRAVLEPAMEGRDMICRAITGSGKTLAFGIPILDKIIQNKSPQRGKRVPTALVLAPTRELARQVQKEFKESAPNLSSACLYGGIPIIHQSRMLGYGIDIAVGTPGRIIDLAERGALDLSEIKFVVLDEADQMLAIGFQEAVECILSYLPAKKQCMLFSATMPSWVNEISRKYLKNPLVIDLVGDSEQKLADGISLYSVPSTASRKQNNLLTLISKYGQGGKSIVFTKTKKDAELLSRSMGGALGSQALHGNMQQFQRDKTIAAFRDGRFNVLVATDVAARGLDIPNVDLVVHFEIPNTSEIFVHRSGRTGRAGKRGTTVLMFTESQRRAVKYIERDLGCKFEELPKITEGVGNITGSMGMEENHYERYGDDQFPRRPFGGYGQSRGQSYGSTNETRGQYSNGFKLRYGDDQSPRRAVGGYGQSRGQSYGNTSERGQYSNGFKLGARKTHSGRTRFQEYDNEFNNSQFSRKGVGSGANRPGGSSRFGFSKYGLEKGSFALDRNFDEGAEHVERKRRSVNSESSHNDFKQILDALRDH